MLGLNIVYIEVFAETNGGRFSTKIPFKNGLNIIRAENSTGKSTCINAIAYGLGLESILGPGRKKPFPKSLYEVIYGNKNDEKPYYVNSSGVSIRIRNSGGKVATLNRDILGNHNKIAVQVDADGGDYFLGSAGKVGSAISQKGFHHWLANFIGWNLPKVVTYEGKETSLYLECIFPLFFIEQKRGWSEIQANIPGHFGIRNLKRSAVEFCLEIESFEYEMQVAILKKRIESAQNEWSGLRLTARTIADINSVQVNKISDIDKDIIHRIDFNFLENDVCINVDEQEKSLNKLIEKLSHKIADEGPHSEELGSQLTVMRVLRRKFEETSNSVEMVMQSISEVDSKISTLDYEYDQYQQLKRLKSVGGDVSSDIDTQKCPICESDLYDTLGSRTVKRLPMTLGENIEFLKNQLDFFGSIKRKSTAQLLDFKDGLKLLNSKMEVENDKLSNLREEIDDIHGATKSIMRKSIEAKNLLRAVLKLKEKQGDLNEQLDAVHSRWANASKALKQLRKGSKVTDDGLIIRKLESIIKGNLTAFSFDQSAISSISISHQTLRLEQEGYDIVADTSASDFIRTIWSYTLALLELAGKEERVKHGGFVVFDEPRQHEASKVSFASLIGKASESGSFGGQVIFATSLDKSELTVACEGKEVNLAFFDNYILTIEKN